MACSVMTEAEGSFAWEGSSKPRLTRGLTSRAEARHPSLPKHTIFLASISWQKKLHLTKRHYSVHSITPRRGARGLACCCPCPVLLPWPRTGISSPLAQRRHAAAAFSPTTSQGKLSSHCLLVTTSKGSQISSSQWEFQMEPAEKMIFKNIFFPLLAG